MIAFDFVRFLRLKVVVYGFLCITLKVSLGVSKYNRK